jgi:hypothetical protein
MLSAEAGGASPALENPGATKALATLSKLSETIRERNEVVMVEMLFFSVLVGSNFKLHWQ